MERTRDPEDNRAYRIAPTPKAREALPRFIAVSNRSIRRYRSPGGSDKLSGVNS